MSRRRGPSPVVNMVVAWFRTAVTSLVVFSLLLFDVSTANAKKIRRVEAFFQGAWNHIMRNNRNSCYLRWTSGVLMNGFCYFLSSNWLTKTVVGIFICRWGWNEGNSINSHHTVSIELVWRLRRVRVSQNVPPSRNVTGNKRLDREALF